MVFKSVAKAEENNTTKVLLFYFSVISSERIQILKSQQIFLQITIINDDVSSFEESPKNLVAKVFWRQNQSGLRLGRFAHVFLNGKRKTSV